MKLLIFTYAPTGLGHLRVTDALVDARPKDSQYILLGSMDRFITWIHRYTSISPFGKFIFYQFQYGFYEEIFTWFYRNFLILTSEGVYKQLKDLIDRNPDADHVYIVATHFGMAHQIGAVKDRLIKDTGKDIKLIVQVTDDTSQHIWCVKGADITFVPSQLTKKKFEEYASAHKIPFVSDVIPYPLSGTLIKNLKGVRQKVFAEKTGKINVAIPISGAAVGLGYFQNLVKELSALSDRFVFWILVKKSPFTEMFINNMSKLPGVNLLVGNNDIQMIGLYELLYEKNLIHIEITKPSEQAFKAILSPKSIGGSILLFTSPVGRQELDNINFLTRHKLIPIPGLAVTPRAIRISSNPKIAAKFIAWALNSGLFTRMSNPDFKFSKKSLLSGEVGANGAKLFWKRVEKMFGD